uniref:Autophagy protein 5 n=1 Tax=Arion vulgaris TaxID=1028688 RepID=A0A0B6YT48_9EUPU
MLNQATKQKCGLNTMDNRSDGTTLGVLYDLYGHQSDLPWKLTVHFKNFPEDELLHCLNKEAVESHFMSVIKEADAMKHRSQAINSMQRKDHKTLWAGFMNDKFDQFWSVNKKLMENSGEDTFKHIPFRIYKVDKSSSDQQQQHVTIQKLFKPSEDSGENLTLRHLLDVAVPELTGKGEMLNYHVVTQGIRPVLETPVVWMSEHLSYPDNFLHICLVPQVDNES